MEKIWEFTKKYNEIGKEYRFFQGKKKKILKGIMKKYKLDEEYEISILKSNGKVITNYLSPLINTNLIKMIFILRGKCRVILNGSERELVVSKGDIIIYRATEELKNAFFNSDNLESITLDIYLDKFNKNLFKLASKDKVLKWDNKVLNILDNRQFSIGKSNSEIDRITNYIVKAEVNDIEKYLRFKVMVFQLFLSVLDLKSKNFQNSRKMIDFEKKVFEIKKSIGEYDFLNMPSVKELCSKLGISYYQIKEIFEEIEGMSLSKYIQKLKMEYAKKLIEKNELSIIEIAYEVGYENPSKFSKAFKNYFGILPSKYL